MIRQKHFPFFVLAFLLFTPTFINSQTKPKTNDISANLKWLGEVSYIITEKEKNAFLTLQTDKERKDFIEAFWQRRAPDPDTDENEYKEEFYERIVYANKNFSTKETKGWKTDRGRLYIEFGKPDEIRTRFGKVQDGRFYEDETVTQKIKAELWFYRWMGGLDFSMEIVLVDKKSNGEFTVLCPAREQLFRANDGLAQTIATNKTPFDFDVRVDFFRQSEYKTIVVLSIEVENKALSLIDGGGVYAGQLNIYGTIINYKKKRLVTIEDLMRREPLYAEIETFKKQTSVYQKAFPLSSDRYLLQIKGRDVISCEAKVTSIAFEVPKYDSENLSTSSLILASQIEELTHNNMFGATSKKVTPNVRGIFQRGKDIGVYMQIYNAGLDEITLQPTVDVEYVITKKEKDVLRVVEDWKEIDESGQRIVLSRFLKTDSLESGDYELQIRIRDKKTNEQITKREQFRIKEVKE